MIVVITKSSEVVTDSEWVSLSVSAVCVCVTADRAEWTHIPMVDINVELKASSESLKSTHVLPTPESPISRSLKR